LQAFETEKFYNTRQTKQSSKEDKFKTLKENAINALQKRIQSSRNDLKKERDLELKR
jgi:hypothetical protein